MKILITCAAGRNVYTLEPLTEWLAKLRVPNNDPKGRKWVNSVLQRHLINEAPTTVVHTVPNNAPDWAKKACSAGDLVNLDLTDLSVPDYEHALAWALQQPDPQRVSVPVALLKGQESIDRSNRRATDDEGKIKTVCDLGDGFTLVNCMDKQALKREGKIMQHCVGDETNGYWEQVRDDDIWVLSIRDSSNQPHVTIELNLHHNLINQIRGKQNNIPALKYQPATAAALNWLHSKKFLWVYADDPYYEWDALTGDICFYDGKFGMLADRTQEDLFSVLRGDSSLAALNPVVWVENIVSKLPAKSSKDIQDLIRTTCERQLSGECLPMWSTIATTFLQALSSSKCGALNFPPVSRYDKVQALMRKGVIHAIKVDKTHVPAISLSDEEAINFVRNNLYPSDFQPLNAVLSCKQNASKSVRSTLYHILAGYLIQLNSFPAEWARKSSYLSMLFPLLDTPEFGDFIKAQNPAAEHWLTSFIQYDPVSVANKLLNKQGIIQKFPTRPILRKNAYNYASPEQSFVVDKLRRYRDDWDLVLAESLGMDRWLSLYCALLKDLDVYQAIILYFSTPRDEPPLYLGGGRIDDPDVLLTALAKYPSPQAKYIGECLFNQDIARRMGSKPSLARSAAWDEIKTTKYKGVANTWMLKAWLKPTKPKSSD